MPCWTTDHSLAGTPRRCPWRAATTTAASWPRPRPRPASTSRSSPARAASSGGASRWWRASSTSSRVRSAWPRPSGSPPPLRGPPPNAFRCWRHRVRVAPACKRAPSRSCRWSRSRRPSSCTSGPILRISCTYGTRPPAGCSRRGARWATSRSPSRARSSASSARASTSTSTASAFPKAFRLRRICSGTASSTPSSRWTGCAASSTGR